MTFETQSPKPSTFVRRCLLVLIASSFAPFVTGCGSTATIARRSDVPLEAKITRHDGDRVYIQTFTGDGEVGISRQDIVDIDHPGNVAATIGGILTGYGIANIIVGVPQCDTQGAAYCTGVFLPAAIGGPLLIYGLTTWERSVEAAGKADKSSARRLTVVPIASMDKTNQFYGASARVSF